ncbi:MAG: PAS domain S-box protein [Myxococcales bacterium]|nr:PAS domain S-box protein [Myxococcales bacterium]
MGDARDDERSEAGSPSDPADSAPHAFGAPVGFRLDELIEATQDGVVFIDAESRICRFNAAAQEMFGFSEAEALGQDVTLLMDEPDAGQHRGYIRRYEATGEGKMIGATRRVIARRKCGDLFPVELSVTRLTAGAVHYAAFIRDVSAEEALQRRLLEAERLAAVGTTAAVFAHEVGNPLNNMSLFAQLLMRRLQEAEIPDDARQDLEAVITEIDRLKRLLDEFRSFRRQEPLHITPVDLGRVLPAVCRALAVTQSGLKIAHEIEDGLPMIQASEDKLKQVFVNLVKNAIEAMPEGGTLELHACAEGHGVCVKVSDTGPGIPQDFDVFLPFRSTKARGSGLGLSVVREIVEAHGGTVHVESEPGRGSTFTVRLPIAGPNDG